MSAIRKVPLNKFSCIKDALECLWSITKVGQANQIDIVFDSYVENSIKESTRASCSNAAEPVEYVNILLESSPPVEVDRLLASSKKKGGTTNFITGIFPGESLREEPYYSIKWVCY